MTCACTARTTSSAPSALAVPVGRNPGLPGGPDPAVRAGNAASQGEPGRAGTGPGSRGDRPGRVVAAAAADRAGDELPGGHVTGGVEAGHAGGAVVVDQ